MRKYPNNIDPLIEPAVKILTEHGFKTFESCQGGEGHCFPEPTVRFSGNEYDLLRAFEICQFHLLPVYEARRVFRKEIFYDYNDKEKSPTPIGEAWESPFNELIFLSTVVKKIPDTTNRSLQ